MSGSLRNPTEDAGSVSPVTKTRGLQQEQVRETTISRQDPQIPLPQAFGTCMNFAPLTCACYYCWMSQSSEIRHQTQSWEKDCLLKGREKDTFVFLIVNITHVSSVNQRSKINIPCLPLLPVVRSRAFTSNSVHAKPTMDRSNFPLSPLFPCFKLSCRN